jgi:3-deoxy-D-manno-octulosonic-acid transferase
MPASTQPPTSIDWRFILYNLLLVLLSPLLVLYLLWRVVVKGKSRAGLRERLGLVPESAAALAAHEDPVIWFQACSVGEVGALAPIIRVFRELEPLCHIVLSTTTTTGREAAERRRVEVDSLIYFPFDLPFVVGTALTAVKPDLLVMVETELWPNILAAARSMGVRTAVINGRISDRAYPRDRLARPIISWAMDNLQHVLVQSDRDAERFRALGAAPAKVEVLGNAKFDEELPVVSAAEAAKLRLELGLPDRAPVLVAGSTREGEEEKVLDAFELMREQDRDLQLIIAPRHPERGEAVERLVMDRGYAAYRRSRAVQEEAAFTPEPQLGPQVRVVILDTIGELTRFYSLATVVFVGGSLVPWGGHNILQPIALGKPTLMGPHMHNQQDIADIALRAQAAVTVRDAGELAEAASRIIASPAEQELLVARGRAMLESQRGASRRYAERLARMLEEAGQSETATLNAE